MMDVSIYHSQEMSCNGLGSIEKYYSKTSVWNWQRKYIPFGVFCLFVRCVILLENAINESVKQYAILIIRSYCGCFWKSSGWELKGAGKDKIFFIPFKLCILSKLGCLIISDINKQIRNMQLCTHSYLAIRKLKQLIKCSIVSVLFQTCCCTGMKD